MSEESGSDRTEEPTEKRQQDSRDKGQVALSREAASVGVLLAVTAVTVVWMPGMARHARVFTATIIRQSATNPEASLHDLPLLALHTVGAILTIVGPLLAVAVVAALVLTVSQVGLMWTWKPMAPQWDRLDPIKGLQNKLASMQALAEWVKSLAKVGIIAFVAYRLGRDNLATLPDLAGRDLEGGLAVTAYVLVRLVGYVLLPMAALALADFVFQRWSTHDKMKMTRDEVKREHKEMDGDPLMKGKRRQRALQLSQNRLVAEVSEATVVVTNPSHYAVALRYEIGQLGPPLVVASGVDLMAERIKQIARSEGVPRVENRALARALYSSARVGQHIPSELFEAVAEVLAFVFRLRERRRSAPPTAEGLAGLGPA